MVTQNARYGVLTQVREDPIIAKKSIEIVFYVFS